MTNKKEMTAPNVSVGADTEQSPNVCTNSITDLEQDFKEIEEMQREMFRQMQPSYLQTVSMADLYETDFEAQSALIDNLLYRGTYLFVGSPKVGKSFMMGTACVSHQHRYAALELQSETGNCPIFCT